MRTDAAAFRWDEGNVEKLFELKECLGEGTYGTVWTAIDRRTNEIVAVKIQTYEDDEDLDYLRLEINLMRRSQSPYTVEFRGCFKPENKDDEVWIVMEHCIAGSLADLMNVCESTFEEEQIQQVAAAVTLGLARLHDACIIHRDIKAGNILLNTKGNIRITDLGVGADLKTKDERRNTLIGAPYWMAPEIMLEQGYDNRVDIWSLGITIIELADSVPPNAGIQGEDNILKLIPTQKPPTVRTPAHFSPAMNDFIARCVTRPYNKRSSAKELLSHPFIATTVKQLEANNGRSKILADFVEENKARILRYRKADESLFEKSPSVRVPSQNIHSRNSATEFYSSRFSKMYSEAMSRPESIRTSVMLPTQQGIHGEKVISREAQKLLTKTDVEFMVSNRELRESIKSGVVTPHLAKLLKERRDEEDSLFDFVEDEEIVKKKELESRNLHNKLIFFYSKHEPSKLKETAAIQRLVEIGMQYGQDIINDGLIKKYGEPLPAELPAQTKQRQHEVEKEFLEIQAREVNQDVSNSNTELEENNFEEVEEYTPVKSIPVVEVIPVVPEEEMPPVVTSVAATKKSTKKRDKTKLDDTKAPEEKQQPAVPQITEMKKTTKARNKSKKDEPNVAVQAPPSTQSSVRIEPASVSDVIKSSEKTHQSVRVLKNFSNVKGMFEKSSKDKNKSENVKNIKTESPKDKNNESPKYSPNQVVNRNKNVWEMDVKMMPVNSSYDKLRNQPAGKSVQQFRQPANRFMQPFNAKNDQAPPTKANPGSKWQISPMGYANQKTPLNANEPKVTNFNEVQSWWDKRNMGKEIPNKPAPNKAARNNDHKMTKGSIKNLL